MSPQEDGFLHVSPSAPSGTNRATSYDKRGRGRVRDHRPYTPGEVRHIDWRRTSGSTAAAAFARSGLPNLSDARRQPIDGRAGKLTARGLPRTCAISASGNSIADDSAVRTRPGSGVVRPGAEGRIFRVFECSKGWKRGPTTARSFRTLRHGRVRRAHRHILSFRSGRLRGRAQIFNAGHECSGHIAPVSDRDPERSATCARRFEPASCARRSHPRRLGLCAGLGGTPWNWKTSAAYDIGYVRADDGGRSRDSLKHSDRDGSCMTFGAMGAGRRVLGRARRGHGLSCSSVGRTDARAFDRLCQRVLDEARELTLGSVPPRVSLLSRCYRAGAGLRRHQPLGRHVAHSQRVAAGHSDRL